MERMNDESKVLFMLYLISFGFYLVQEEEVAWAEGGLTCSSTKEDSVRTIQEPQLLNECHLPVFGLAETCSECTAAFTFGTEALVGDTSLK